MDTTDRHVHIAAPVDRATLFRNLIDTRLARGHYKVALRYILMMEAQGLEVSAAHRQRRDESAARCTPEQLATIRQQVRLWIGMLRESPASQASARRMHPPGPRPTARPKRALPKAAWIAPLLVPR